MPSHDKRWAIERYPQYNDEGELESVSYGCGDLDLMGFSNIDELLMNMLWEIKKLETSHKEVYANHSLHSGTEFRTLPGSNPGEDTPEGIDASDVQGSEDTKSMGGEEK